MSTIDVHCESCGFRFEVPHSMKGGVANCPDCKKAVPVPGGFEPLYHVIFWSAAALGLLITTATFLSAPPIAGWIAMGLCIGLLLLIRFGM